MSRVIRMAVPDDLGRMVDIEQRCFHGPAAYPREQLKYLAFKANSVCLVEEDNGIILGFIIVLYRKGTQIAGIETLDVDHAFRNMGVGERLLVSAEKDMRSRGVTTARLEVSAGNRAAVCLYNKLGYRVAEHIKDYYIYEHNGTRDALRMVRDIPADSA